MPSLRRPISSAAAKLRQFGVLCWPIAAHAFGGIVVVGVALWLRARAGGTEHGFVDWLWVDVVRFWLANPDILQQALKSLSVTLSLVLLTLLWTGIASAALAWKLTPSFQRPAWRWLESLVGLSVGLPVLIISIWYRHVFPIDSSRFDFQLGRILGASFILGGAEGNVLVWTRMIRGELRRVSALPFVRAQMARGMPVRKMIWRHSREVVLTSTQARFIQLLSGVVIVEYVLSIRSGLGYVILDLALSSSGPFDTPRLFLCLVLVILLTATCRLLGRFSQSTLDV